ncbi:hypothetical protein F5X96DRAFT_126833 [Biscogniauxia mediterranea]|nr:hypothetical protein F5X96DRAFT_126833 [Biscogniauxia mediterranea]
MNNFGVIELASTKTTNAPGWAYVPDTGPLQAQSTTNHHHHHHHHRKRARGGTNPGGGGSGALSSADASARQEAKTRKEIEVLDRDNPRDVQIAVPAKPGRSSQQQQRKHTPNVRKILQSQKTFANHLDDYIALGGGDSNPAIPAAAAIVPSVAAAVPTSSSSTRAAASAANASLKKARTEASASGARRASTVKQEDVDMADADDNDNDSNNNNDGSTTRRHSTILTPYPRPRPRPRSPAQNQPQSQTQPSQPPLSPNPNPNPSPSRPSAEDDDNPLLISRVPPLPSDPELRALLSAPPLSYLEVRALSSSSSSRQQQRYPPPRVFCEVCGYWGRVRCLKCGARACALDCLEAHREECVTRYGL